MVSKTSVILLVVVMLCGSAFGNIYWVGGVNNSWFTSGNWDSNSTPTLGDTINIGADWAYNPAPIADVVISGGAAVADAFRVSQGSLTVQSGASLTTGATGWAWIGWGTPYYGVLNIETGATLTCQAVDHGYGGLNVKGGHLEIHGALGGHIFTSTGGAAVTSVSLTDGGSINMDGAFQIANAGTTVFDMNSGTVTTGGSLLIALAAPPCNGTMNMRGGTIHLNAGAFSCGHAGKGVFTMTGGEINCPTLYVGILPTANGTMYLKNGQINLSSDFSIGEAGGTGLLDIENGKIAVTGDWTARANGYVSSGVLTAFGGHGAGKVIITYDAGSNVTTISGKACAVGDLNGDCYVNFLDFAIFAQNWLK